MMNSASASVRWRRTWPQRHINGVVSKNKKN